jgi:hypothetical protein
MARDALCDERPKHRSDRARVKSNSTGVERKAAEAARGSPRRCGTDHFGSFRTIARHGNALPGQVNSLLKERGDNRV